MNEHVYCARLLGNKKVSDRDCRSNHRFLCQYECGKPHIPACEGEQEMCTRICTGMHYCIPCRSLRQQGVPRCPTRV